MVHRLVLTVGGTGIGGLGDPFLAAVPLPVSSSARPGEPGSIVVGDYRRSDRCYLFAARAWSSFCTCCWTWASSASNMAPLRPALCKVRFGYCW